MYAYIYLSLEKSSNFAVKGQAYLSLRKGFMCTLVWVFVYSSEILVLKLAVGNFFFVFLVCVCVFPFPGKTSWLITSP